MGRSWIHQVSAELGRHAESGQLPANVMPVGADEIGAGGLQPSGMFRIGVTATGVADRRHAGGNSLNGPGALVGLPWVW